MHSQLLTRRQIAPSHNWTSRGVVDNRQLLSQRTSYAVLLHTWISRLRRWLPLWQTSGVAVPAVRIGKGACGPPWSPDADGTAAHVYSTTRGTIIGPCHVYAVMLCAEIT